MAISVLVYRSAESDVTKRYVVVNRLAVKVPLFYAETRKDAEKRVAEHGFHYDKWHDYYASFTSIGEATRKKGKRQRKQRWDKAAQVAPLLKGERHA